MIRMIRMKSGGYGTRLMGLVLFAGFSTVAWSPCEAYLTRAELVNLPRHLTGVEVHASSVLGDHAARLAVDGKRGTRWDSGLKASSGNPQWLMVDLGGIHEIARVSLLGATPGQRRLYSVSVSSDNETWTRILPVGKPAQGLEGMAGGPGVRISRFDPILAQYIKYEVFGGNGWSTARLREMRIIGNPAQELTQVPLPAGIWLMGSGLVMLAGMSRARERAHLP